jgi:mannose-6-phosphate isomerase-like protein (cupin superfamily)
MDAKGFIVPFGQGPVWDMSPGRSATLKLQSAETGERVMMFEEAAPAGTATVFHVHHNSDEMAYVLSGEIMFKIGDQVTLGGPWHVRIHATRHRARLEDLGSRSRKNTLPIHAG